MKPPLNLKKSGLNDGGSLMVGFEQKVKLENKS